MFCPFPPNISLAAPARKIRSRLATSRPLASGLVDHPHMGSHVDAIDDFTAPPTQIVDHSVNAGDLVDF